MSVGTHPDLDAQPIDQLTVNTIRDSRWTRCRRRTRVIRARRWRWPRWGTRCGRGSCGSIPSCRCGPTATASCSRPGTPPRCSTRCCTCPGSSRSTRTTRPSGTPAVTLDDLQPVPPARLQVPRAPRVPVDLRGGVHHRPAGHRHRDQRRHGDRRALAGRHVQPARLRPVRLRRLRDRRRRLPDGGHRRRGRLAGRAPQAVEPVLVLRQQPDHHRGRHEPRVQRGRAGPVRRAGLGGAARHRRQRPRRAERRDRGVQGRDRPADADRRRQRDRLRRPAQAGHPRRPRRAPGRRRGRRDQALLPLARGRGLPRPRPGPRALRRRDARERRAAAAASGRSCSPATRRSTREQAEQLNHMQRRTLPDGWDADLPEFPPDPKGVASRDSGGKVLNAVARAGAVADRRVVGPGAVEQVAPDLRGRGRLQRRRPGRAQPALRGPRARRRRGLPTGSRCPSCAPTRPGSSSSPTSSAARCGSPR